jgi:hypothetical protein
MHKQSTHSKQETINIPHFLRAADHTLLIGGPFSFTMGGFDYA